MRRRVAIVFMVIGALAALPAWADGGKTDRYLTAYLATADASAGNLEKLSSFIDHLASKRSSFRSEKEFVRFVFYKSHQKFLKLYQPAASFGDLTRKGVYNCLTGTALYALLLDHFEISHQVIETNYHIFILANVAGGKVLLEATDPMSGFVDNAEEVEKRLEGYRANKLQASLRDSEIQYEFHFNLWETVSLTELTGLLYFNQAVQTFNAGKLEQTVAYLIEASRYRPSMRMEEFARLVTTSVSASSLPETEKDKCLAGLRGVRRQSIQWMAASAGL